MVRLKLRRSETGIDVWFQTETGEFRSKIYRLDAQQFESLFNAVMELRRLTDGK